MEKINNFISRLAPGSIAVVVNDREKFEHFRTLNSGARTFHITQETDPVGTIMTELFGNSS
ncbi:MAG: hypothetical protein OEU95_01260, partial [Nitrospirota bacterium]|nr:hypothetical protein [Nitrospirota bacterium]